MTILHVINIHGYGGAEKLLLVSLPALRKKGIEVKCLVFHQKDKEDAAQRIAQELSRDGISVTTYAYARPWEKAIFSRITQSVSEAGADLVHSHLKYADLWLSVLKNRKKITVPVVTTLHGYRDSYQNKHGLTVHKSIRFTPYYWLTRFVCRKLDGYILISECLKKFYVSSGLLKNKPARVIYHGYELDGLPDLKPGISSLVKDPVIAVPGRLIKMKGHRFALEAFSELLSSYPAASLHIFGSGPEEEAIKEQVQRLNLHDRVILHGYVNDLPERLRACQLVLLPSLWESFGIVFLDAFAAGVPVVAFDLPAGNEIVIDNYSGLLAEPYNSHSLAEKMKVLLNNEHLRNDIIRNAHQLLKSKFSAGMMADKYIDFYKEII